MSKHDKICECKNCKADREIDRYFAALPNSSSIRMIKVTDVPVYNIKRAINRLRVSCELLFEETEYLNDLEIWCDEIEGMLNPNGVKNGKK